MERLLPADYHALATKLGIRWLGPVVSNTKTKTGWECTHGNQRQASFEVIQKGRDCPVCPKFQKRTTADYHALATKLGIRWLGPEVPTTTTKTGWECNQGHQWQAHYNSLHYNGLRSNGNGCRVCAGSAKKTPTDYHALAQERGFRWLGPEVANTSVKTGWECSQGHQWQTIYATIQQGHGCPTCQIKTPTDYHALAQERDFRWLGPEVANTFVKTGWECSQGHQWQTTYRIIREGSDCPICAGLAKKTPTDYHALAQERGFRWLGPEVANTSVKTGWECSQGHQWQARYNDLRNRANCPICINLVNGKKVSNPQWQLWQILGGTLNKPFNNYTIDIVLEIENVFIAVEYDSWYWHGGNQERDQRRCDDLVTAGWRVLRIRSKELLPTLSQINLAIQKILGGESVVTLTLKDWGRGTTRF